MAIPRTGAQVPSGEPTVCELERSTMLLMGKSTISMAIFNCYVSSPEGTALFVAPCFFCNATFFLPQHTRHH